MKKMRNFVIAAAITSSVAVVPASVQAAEQDAEYKGSFSSTALTFTLDKNVTSFDALIASTYTINKQSKLGGFDITGFSLVNTGTNTTYAGTVMSGYPTKTADNGNTATYSDKFSISNLSLTAGNYRFVVTGTGSPTSYTGSYDYNYKIASPVPEPATYAMLLAGLAIVGTATYRKNKRGSIKSDSFAPNFGSRLAAA